jgi:hypothetical protein
MASLSAEPQLMSAAAADVAEIGSAIGAARAVAMGPTTSLAAAAKDEVSVLVATFFNSYAQQYQVAIGRAASFNDQFAQLLAAAANTYAQAEAEATTSLGPLTTPVQALLAPLLSDTMPSPVYTPATMGSDPTVNAILIFSPSGTATPSPTFMNNVFSRYLTSFTSLTGLTPVSTAEGLYPFTGVKDLTLDISVARGVTEMDNAIVEVLGPAPSAKSVSVLGYSQSGVIAAVEMPKLLAEGYNSSNAYFTLLGDESNPNGGVLARFPGLSFPSLGATFGTVTPSNDFPTTIWTLEYDGFADFPKYPIDVLSDLNAVAGIVYVHPTYSTLSADQIASAVTLTQSGAPSMTTYHVIPTANLPLLDPLRLIPGIGNPLADLVQPDLRYLVNWGYGDPNYGWSTGPADVPTPFGFLPPPSATTSLGPLLISGTQQGVHDFFTDLSAAVPTSLPPMSLPAITDSLLTGPSGTGPLAVPTVVSIPPTVDNVLASLESANNNIVGALAGAVSTAYATLLPTADIATAVAVSLPSYDFDLFVNGIIQAVNGDPIGGLVNAFGNPIAADVGLTTLAGGFELVPIAFALETIVTGTPHPGPS